MPLAVVVEPLLAYSGEWVVEVAVAETEDILGAAPSEGDRCSNRDVI